MSLKGVGQGPSHKLRVIHGATGSPVCLHCNILLKPEYAEVKARVFCPLCKCPVEYDLTALELVADNVKVIAQQFHTGSRLPMVTGEQKT